MATLLIRTWNRDGDERIPVRVHNGGYTTVSELQAELRRRWKNSFDVTDLETGVELKPKPGHMDSTFTQQITLE